MELTTRCPECETIFPVSLEQLQLRKGYIRCIQCAHIFDGFEAAVPADGPRSVEHSLGKGPAAASELPPASPYASVHPAQPAQPVKPFSIGADRTPAPEPARPFSISASRAPAPEPSESFEPFTISDRGERSEARRDEPQVWVRDPLESTRDTEADDYLYVEPRTTRRSDRCQPEFMVAPRRRAWMTPIWAVLSLCGLLLLGAQGVYVYRAQLANTFPEFRPLLERACEPLHCSVPYDRKIEAIAITGSALRSSGPPDGEVSQLMLEVTMRNSYDRPQEWPTLVLDLKDASGTVVVRRNLAPDAWVPADLRNGPFAAGSEVRVQLPVSVRGLQANGYQLDKFFP